MNSYGRTNQNIKEEYARMDRTQQGVLKIIDCLIFILASEYSFQCKFTFETEIKVFDQMHQLSEI
jgi:hypothetical protein